MHRSTWICVVVVAGTVGLWASVRAMSLAGAVTLFVCVGVGAACVAASMAEEADRPPWRGVLTVGTAWGGAVVAAVGLLVWVGLSGLVLVAALVVFSPGVLTAVTRRCRAGRRGGARPGRKALSACSGRGATRAGDAPGRDHEAPAGTDAAFLRAAWMDTLPRAMDDVTLCLAWRQSYVGLQRPLTLALRLRIVDRRRELLDELERRNAAGFAAWLASGARAAGDPSRYICRLRRRAHPGDRG